MKTRPNEFELIAKYFAPLASESAFGLLDDAALIDIPDGKKLVITQDALAEGVHFFADDLPRLIAKKALRVNVSDLVAKGAKPFAYSLALGLAEDWSEKWVAAFAKGLAEDQASFEMVLSGGDTFHSPAGTIISVTALGLVEESRYTSRLGAREGDTVFVTGTIGDSALGLVLRREGIDKRLLGKHERNFLLERYLVPQPVSILIDIIGQFASASMDISDGLLGDLEKLCKASNVGARVNVETIPLSSPVQKIIQVMPEHLETALGGGDDYELLFSVPPDKVAEFKFATELLPVRIAEIGVVKPAGHGVVVKNKEGIPLTFHQTSYRHF